MKFIYINLLMLFSLTFSSFAIPSDPMILSGSVKINSIDTNGNLHFYVNGEKQSTYSISDYMYGINYDKVILTGIDGQGIQVLLEIPNYESIQSIYLTFDSGTNTILNLDFVGVAESTIIVADTTTTSSGGSSGGSSSSSSNYYYSTTTENETNVDSDNIPESDSNPSSNNDDLINSNDSNKVLIEDTQNTTKYNISNADLYEQSNQENETNFNWWLGILLAAIIIIVVLFLVFK